MSSPNEDIPVFSHIRFLAFRTIVFILIVLYTNGTYSVFCPSVWLVLSPAVSSTWGYMISMALSLKKHQLKLFVPLHLFAFLCSAVSKLLTTSPILSAHKTIVQWVRDICPSDMGPLPSRNVPGSWWICSFNPLSQVLNLDFSASLSSPVWGYWRVFRPYSLSAVSFPRT